MKIKIYQINLQRDEKRVAFASLDILPHFQGSAAVDAGIYDLVFDGEVKANGLEAVYRIFNLSHPEGYKGRSMSVSDVVEMTPEDREAPAYFFCDSIGFEEIEFDADKAGTLCMEG